MRELTPQAVETFKHQILYRSLPRMTVTAIADDSGDVQTRTSTEVAPKGLGWERVLDAVVAGAVNQGP